MADVVAEVLREAAEKEARFKSIEVQKDAELDFDQGNLLASDPNPLDLKKLRQNKDDYLLNLARDNTQLLINKLWQLPTEKNDGIVNVKLPETLTVIPREKPAPKPKPLTKWEQFAKVKGITKKKKSRMVWDDVAKDWRPRWGYKRANDDTKDWCIEVPTNADPNEDQFAKRKAAKKERVAKNELKRLRNIARAQKLKVSELHTPAQVEKKQDVNRKLALAKYSTASVGKFTETLPNEKPAKNVGKKRKFAPNHGDIKEETSHQLGLLKKIANKKPIIDVTKATNKQLHEDEVARSKVNKINPKKKFKEGSKKAKKVEKHFNKKALRGKTLGKKRRR
ncbi:biogenesis regulatory homolog [Octopus vulgaris]|uniref:Biogenesis regulatory homolog n=2 Tax=Octopus TaxID=6643 RepID=A0AA36ASK6_OCTVU|nr:ribosome biogenesis regulatory protein homolog [Octopus sinensis]CAI9720047.1 biogenesis regulatory homolog [Octopus vulgaris]